MALPTGNGNPFAQLSQRSQWGARLGAQWQARFGRGGRGRPGARPPGTNPAVPGSTAPNPGAPATAPAQAPAPTDSTDPRDAQYYQNVADNQFKVNNQINALNLDRSNAQTALQSQLAQLAYQQPRDQLAMEQRANQAGSLYSSVEGQNQGNLAYQFAGRKGADQANEASTLDRLASQIAALQQGVPIYDQGQFLDSISRAAQAAAANPATGQGTAPPVTAPGTAAPTGGGGAHAGGHGGHGGGGGRIRPGSRPPRGRRGGGRSSGGVGY